MEVDDLEAKWEQQYEYNNNNDEEEENGGGDGSNMEVVNGDKVMNTASVVAAPVHMELFYNGSSQDYNGSAAVHDSSSANNVGYAC